MNINAMLNKLNDILEEEQRMRQEIERLETKAQGMGGGGGDDGRKTPRPDKMENAAIEVEQAKDRQAYRRREIMIYRQEAMATFWRLQDHAEAYVLDLYYIRGLTVRQIAEEIGMSKSWVDDKKQQGIRRLMRL